MKEGREVFPRECVFLLLSLYCITFWLHEWREEGELHREGRKKEGRKKAKRPARAKGGKVKKKGRERKEMKFPYAALHGWPHTHVRKPSMMSDVVRGRLDWYWYCWESASTQDKKMKTRSAHGHADLGNIAFFPFYVLFYYAFQPKSPWPFFLQVLLAEIFHQKPQIVCTVFPERECGNIYSRALGKSTSACTSFHDFRPGTDFIPDSDSRQGWQGKHKKHTCICCLTIDVSGFIFLLLVETYNEQSTVEACIM